MTVDKVHLSKQLKKARVDKDWTQVELSKASGVSVPTITNCERRVSVPTYENLQKLAYALGCSVADLTGEGRHRSFAATHRN